MWNNGATEQGKNGPIVRSLVHRRSTDRKVPEPSTWCKGKCQGVSQDIPDYVILHFLSTCLLE